ncbi:hypothetical protein [Parabacteroides sp. AM08-6]|uniref:hypothetical protein n=1 Tax=Parabacteroides sp. AM08-6 TaxID=2292053 RepID=UPI000EFDD32B|nr:hypothetical protein [Parabacteroides sp. AM08-6]RHJ86445.1 hypothetical protein DW103_01835 [Parabacteroides sp. AM08-6]
MKILNLISGICLLAVGLFSCTSEEEIGPAKGNASLSVVFSVGDATTKATLAEGYKIATTDEIKINNFYVAIFAGDGTKIDDATVSDVADATSVKVGELPGYQVSFQDVYVRHKKVFALVVANASDNKLYSTFEGYTNYSQYTNINNDNVIETSIFEAGNLAKSGVSSTETLTSGTNLTLTVPLTQLTARIDFGTISAAETKAGTNGETSSKDEYSYSDWGIVALQGTIDDTIWNDLRSRAEAKANASDGTWEPKSNKKEEISYGLSDYQVKCDDEAWYYTWKHYNQWKTIENKLGGYFYSVIYGEWKSDMSSRLWYRYRSAYYGKRILLVRRKVSHYKVTSTTSPDEEYTGGFVGTISGVVNGKINTIFETSGNNAYAGVSVDGIAQNTSFYTYEFPANEDLTITLHGHFEEASSGGSESTSEDKTLVEEYWEYGIWEQTSTDGTWNVSSDLTGISRSVTWYGDKGLKTPIATKAPEISSLKSASTDDVYYVVKWSEDVTDAKGNAVTLQRGKRYKLNSVQLKQNKAHLVVSVASWSNAKFDVIYGEETK